MKKAIFTLAFIAMFAVSAVAHANDDAEEVCEPVVSTPLAEGYCEPLPPVCSVPAPVCEKPAKKLVYEDEEYTVNEVKSELVYEQRTRKVQKKIDVLRDKAVTDSRIAVVESNTGKQPRLARGKTIRQIKVKAKETIVEDEDYLQPIRLQTIEPVTRTRKVAKLVDND